MIFYLHKMIYIYTLFIYKSYKTNLVHYIKLMKQIATASVAVTNKQIVDSEQNNSILR